MTNVVSFVPYPLSQPLEYFEAQLNHCVLPVTISVYSSDVEFPFLKQNLNIIILTQKINNLLIPLKLDKYSHFP